VYRNGVPDTPTTSGQIFARLMRDILSGSLRPRDQLSEREVVQRFGVSRTPAREAITASSRRASSREGRAEPPWCETSTATSSASSTPSHLHLEG